MVKRELIAALARKNKELPVGDVETIARLIFDSMTEALADGAEIELRGFGSFRLRTYAARQARNPGSGEIVDLDERLNVLFRTGEKLKERLNNDE